jgi:ribosomal protein S18 acetylase RimI-like enzyme
MLGVAVGTRGRGVGEALVRACIERARAAGAKRVWLHTEPFMEAAHRLYARLGFVRAPAQDWRFEEEGEPDVILLAYVLEL